MVSQHALRQTPPPPPPVNRITHACENITLPQLRNNSSRYVKFMIGCSGFDQKNKDCLKTDTFECAFSFQVLMNINQDDSVMEKEDGLGDSPQYMKPTSGRSGEVEIT